MFIILLALSFVNIGSISGTFSPVLQYIDFLLALSDLNPLTHYRNFKEYLMFNV